MDEAEAVKIMKAANKACPDCEGEPCYWGMYRALQAVKTEQSPYGDVWMEAYEKGLRDGLALRPAESTPMGGSGQELTATDRVEIGQIVACAVWNDQDCRAACQKLEPYLRHPEPPKPEQPDTLVERLQACINPADELDTYEAGRNNGLRKAIAIVKAHRPELVSHVNDTNVVDIPENGSQPISPSAGEVERVVRSLMITSETLCSGAVLTYPEWEVLAKAAISAMQSATEPDKFNTSSKSLNPERETVDQVFEKLLLETVWNEMPDEPTPVDAANILAAIRTIATIIPKG